MIALRDALEYALLTKKIGGIKMETKGLTCKLPLDLHNRISEEIRETESTVSRFIEMVIREHYEKGDGRRLKHCNLSTIPKKSAQNQAP